MNLLGSHPGTFRGFKKKYNQYSGLNWKIRPDDSAFKGSILETKQTRTDRVFHFGRGTQNRGTLPVLHSFTPHLFSVPDAGPLLLQ